MYKAGIFNFTFFKMRIVNKIAIENKKADSIPCTGINFTLFGALILCE